MYATRYRLAARYVALAWLFTLGCEGTQHPAEPTPTPPGPTTGAIEIVVSTSGNTIDLDGDGYSLQVDAGQSTAISVNGVVTFSDLAEGAHVVKIKGLAPNCSFVDASERSVIVYVGGKTVVSFAITCAALAPLSIGEMAYVNGEGGDAEIYVIKSGGGAPLRLTNQPGWDGDPAWSPDGSKIAFTSMRNGNKQIYVMNSDGTNPVRLTNSSGENLEPAWSPDGTKIAFVAQRGGSFDKIYVMNADGTNVQRLTDFSGGNDTSPDWSPDGSRIAFANDGCCEFIGIWIMKADGSAPTQLTFNYREDTQPAWSPDGTMIAFNRTLYYTTDLYLVNVDGTGLRQLTNGKGVEDPTWSPDGGKIAFGSFSLNGGCNDGSLCNHVIRILGIDGSAVESQATGQPSYSPAWRR